MRAVAIRMMPKPPALIMSRVCRAILVIAARRCMIPFWGAEDNASFAQKGSCHFDTGKPANILIELKCRNNYCYCVLASLCRHKLRIYSYEMKTIVVVVAVVAVVATAIVVAT